MARSFLLQATMPAVTFCWPQQALSIRKPWQVPSRTSDGQGTLIRVPSWRCIVLTLMLLQWHLKHAFISLRCPSWQPIGFTFALVRARSRSHFRGSPPGLHSPFCGSDSGGGSSTRLPSRGSISSSQLASPCRGVPAHHLPHHMPRASTPRGLQQRLLVLPASSTPAVPGQVRCLRQAAPPRLCASTSAHSTCPTPGVIYGYGHLAGYENLDRLLIPVHITRGKRAHC